MSICETDALRVESMSLDHAADLAHLGDLDLAQRVHSAEFRPSIPQGAQRDFSNDKWVRGNLSPVEEILHLRVGPMEVVDPDRRVSEDQSSSTLKRLMSFKSGSDPPKAASLREASK